MKRETLYQLLGLLVLIAILSVTPIKRYMAHNPVVNLGLDLRGGVNVLVKCLKPEGRELKNEDISGVQTVMEKRLDPDGVKEISLQRQGEQYINIEIPGEKDVDKIRRQIERFAKLEFIDPKRKYLEDGSDATGLEVVVSGDHLKDAQLSFDQQTGRPAITFNLDAEGSKKFGDFTRKNVQYFLAIALDKRVLSCPRIQGPLYGGVQITGDFSVEEAQEMVNLLNAGKLPVGVELSEVNSIGPTLGRDTIRLSIRAGAIGLVLLLLFMIGYYKLLGLLADCALIVYTFILMSMMSQEFLNVTLTLPGIAGVILSIGMAVDANIIIFERIKEELRIGKSLKASIDAGFSRALAAILDSNFTTLIAAAILYSMGTGPIKGFATTLSLGICISMFSALFVTKLFIMLIINVPALQKTGLYGVKAG